MTSRRRARVWIARACLGAAPLFAALPIRAAEKSEAASAGADWVQSPYRHFLAGQPVSGGRAVVFDEADDPGLRGDIGAELDRLETELYGRQGWRAPFAGDESLRVYVARGESGGVRTTVSRSVEKGRLVEPAVLLDAAGLSNAEIVREIGRQIALATLAGYGVEDPFLSPALSDFLSAAPGEEKDADAWALAAAGELDCKSHPASLGRLWVSEIARSTGGTVVLREAWQRAAGAGEPATAVLLRAIGDEAGLTEDGVLLRSAARLYAAIEPEASPSRLRLLDVESGALDGAAPRAFRVRHRTFLPETEETLRVAWPQDGAAGAAVVRYRDAALPPDVVFFAAGDRRAIPLAGVARVDFLVAGNPSGGRGVAAPVTSELSSVLPYSGLDARVETGTDGGARLAWTTASHEGMWGWVVFREEVLPDGRIARTGPEIVPSAESSPASYRYQYLDGATESATYYRYTVWAVTSEGLLARAFSATVKTAEP